MSLVVGVDACRSGWVAVALRDGAFLDCKVFPRIGEAIADQPEAVVIGVDIPIGLPVQGARRADSEARAFIGPRRSSVFPTPVRAVLEAPTYADALALARRQGSPGLSRQSYALGTRILEVDEIVPHDDRVVEVHPEVCFRAMAGRPVESSKKSWNGLRLRMRLLAENGISLPDGLAGGETVPPTTFSTQPRPPGPPTGWRAPF